MYIFMTQLSENSPHILVYELLQQLMAQNATIINYQTTA